MDIETQRTEKWKTLTRLNAIERIFSMAEGDISKVVLAARCALEAHRTTGCPEVLYIAITILAKLRIHDKELVGKLVDALFNVKGHFLSLFSHTISKGDGVTYGLDDDEESSEYLLTVAAERCYEIGEDVVRFIDVPVGGLTLAAISAFFGATASVLLFLRHGADPEKVFSVLNLHPQLCQKEIAKLVARATPYPGKQLRTFLKLPNPPTLKHLCKFVIRYRLLLNNYLPIGVTALPIVPRLRFFVDLLED